MYGGNVRTRRVLGRELVERESVDIERKREREGVREKRRRTVEKNDPSLQGGCVYVTAVVVAIDVIRRSNVLGFVLVVAVASDPSRHLA